MRLQGSKSSVAVSLGALISSAQAAFLLDFFNERGCWNSGCLRALSSASDIAIADCSIFYTAQRHAQVHASTSVDYPVPTYASACSDAWRFETACSCFGVVPSLTPFGTTTTTVTVPTTTAKTGYANAIGPRQRPAATKVVAVNLDAPLDLKILCKGEVADALAAVDMGVGGTGEAVAATVTKTVSVAGTTTVTKSVTAVSVSVSTKSMSGSCVPSATTTGRALVANAAAVPTSNSAVVAALSSSLPAGCLTDAQVKAIVGAFKVMLTSRDKGSVKKIAEGLIAEEFMGISSSANSLKGDEASNLTYPNAASFAAFLSSAPPIPELTTLDVFHDCNRIAWYWAAVGMAGRSEVERGIHLLYTIDGGVASLSDGILGDGGEEEANVAYGGKKVNIVMFEFDSLGWVEIEGGV